MISVIIPIYNEKDSIDPLQRDIERVMKGLEQEYEILFVDDGSTDGSTELIREKETSSPAIRAIFFRKNFGKSATLNAGFQASRGEIIFTMDGDLQDDPEEIPRFLAKLDEGYDLVTGWKVKRKDPLEKRLPSKLFNAITSRMSGLNLRDYNCGFKCYRREVIKEIRLYGELHRFIPSWPTRRVSGWRRSR
ncbi:hypothetical protein GF1_28970 [Desulfolithobacter dissulfuricans]|uniref:Glycosyltransferase 2-like domain-containing protein n=1 Tax=Desulfolithobacter dissulfuricans TaxID=2795293 RepID=A0A915UB14_9BACT|nr:glycosyltransferase family 2 protein [Desulfolithobacter dissulfuricans]BCO10521.1 hypothetical protein GF1_28970 [Desulfolithobacter dissulfuricans]